MEARYGIEIRAGLGIPDEQIGEWLKTKARLVWPPSAVRQHQKLPPRIRGSGSV